jgi:DNA-binding MarR family transcriptional regulator
MRKSHIGNRPDHQTVEEIRIALVELRRLFQRKELAELWAAAAGHASVPGLDYAELRLLDAIRVAESRRPAGATVGDVARLLGVDPSRASRQVARAVAKGHLKRRAVQSDARKVVLEVTPRGARLQARGSALTRARIALALDVWSDAERARFAHLFSRFVGAIVS